MEEKLLMCRYLREGKSQNYTDKVLISSCAVMEEATERFFIAKIKFKRSHGPLLPPSMFLCFQFYCTLTTTDDIEFCFLE